MARKQMSGEDVLKLLDDSDDSESDSDISWDKSDEDTIISDENETDSDDRDAVQPACCTTSDCGHSLAFIFVCFVKEYKWPRSGQERRLSLWAYVTLLDTSATRQPRWVSSLASTELMDLIDVLKFFRSTVAVD